ncbi:hypothetical protein NPIL_383891 [Nephila pilipes]|uniref:Uncharacterized protein n=1 Tax=Nephila pilipes TaxID=299642 RepID=A0A8X6I915_NEPPI|nr:hypothetical protein NPIL_383891 [Nephila pilipes]
MPWNTTSHHSLNTKKSRHSPHLEHSIRFVAILPFRHTLLTKSITFMTTKNDGAINHKWLVKSKITHTISTYSPHTTRPGIYDPAIGSLSERSNEFCSPIHFKPTLQV